MEKPQTECRRCGTCCDRGGPALHLEDAYLVKSGKLPRNRLITIRKGELVVKPHESQPQTANCELIKISGTGRSWQCYYYDGKARECMFYEDRPVACRKLQCWDTAAVEKLVETDTLSRMDIIGDDEPVYEFIQTHEQSIPCPDMKQLQESLARGEVPKLEVLEKLVNDDIRIRTQAVRQLDISLAEELFYFGRPLFQLLQQVGLKVSESGGVLKLQSQ